ncbi:hypothetical protein GCM10009740_02950 [Terrabacter terrae]|uniref:DUF2029 domain-containing protein n=1 Tax=Terrabacter terrae TaxID=318434 RepID=A0ABN2TSZ8_9MICO
MGSVLIGFAVSGSSSLSYWRGGFAELGKFGAQTVVGTHNQSLLAAALRLLGRPEVPLAVQVLLALCGAGLGALAAGRSLASARPGSDVEAVAWIALGGLLASPVSWTHHWVWVVVVLAVFAGRGERARAAVVLLVFWFPIVWMLYTGDNLESLAFPWWKALLSAVYVLAGVTILVDVVLRKSGDGLQQETLDQPRANDPVESTPSSSVSI